MSHADTITQNEFAAAYNAGRASRPDLVTLPSGKQVAFVPDAGTYRLADVADSPDPLRASGAHAFGDLQSFLDFVSAHTAGHTRVECDAAGRFRAVLNAHEPANGEADTVTLPGWEDWIARFEPEPSDEWKTWTARDDTPMSQADFAQFIEENIDDIREPSGADLLELATTFEATTKADFRSAVRLASGQRQLKYEEHIEGKAGQTGQLTIPGALFIQIPVFRSAETAFRIKAHFRYRIDSGQLRLSYKLHRPHKALDLAVDDLVETAAEHLDRKIYRTA